MSAFISFIKTTILGGLFFLLPFLLLALIIQEVSGLLVALSSPITELFPEDTFTKAQASVIFSLVLLLGASFLAGLILTGQTGGRFLKWIEAKTFGRLQFYQVLHRLVSGFGSKGKSGNFLPALLHYRTGIMKLAYLIEDHGTGLATVMVPVAPIAFGGEILIVRRNMVELLDISLAEYTGVIGGWGVGAPQISGLAEAALARESSKEVS